MMRALFVTGSLVHGGAERHTITLMNRLSARGHECHAVYVKNDPSQFPRIHLGRSGTVLCLDAAHYFDTTALRRFIAHIRHVQPTVMVAANAYALMYAFIARRLSGLHFPLLVTYHSTLLLGFKEQVKMLIDRFFFLATDCLVFVCDAQRRYWRQRAVFSRRNEVIYNGVDVNAYNAAEYAEQGHQWRAQVGFADGDYVIGMLAVLRPEKNPKQLLEAVARLRRRGIPARALLIGDGPMRNAIEALAWDLGIEPYVAITGLQEDVRPCLAACDVVTLCSTTEALSLAAIEAMAMGLPVVHSRVGGAAELITHEVNGLLFPVGDTQALVDALARLADRSLARRMGSNARRTVEAQFSEKAMLDRYENLLLDLCHPGIEAHGPTPRGMAG